MGQDRSLMTEKILSLTLKIIYLLTGEDYVSDKKHCEHRTSSNTKTPDPESTPPSLTPERNNDQMILELTNKIIHLLTGEVPIRYQDVAVYFSMEEWEYVDGHQDLYKDVMMESEYPCKSLDFQVENAYGGCNSNEQPSHCTDEKPDSCSTLSGYHVNRSSSLKQTHENSVSCVKGNPGDSGVNTPTDQTQCTFTESPSGHKENLVNTNISALYAPAHIKEEQGGASGRNKWTNLGHGQCAPVPMDVEAVLCDNGNTRDSAHAPTHGANTPTDCRRTRDMAAEKQGREAVVEKPKDNAVSLCHQSGPIANRIYDCRECGQRCSTPSELFRHQVGRCGALGSVAHQESHLTAQLFPGGKTGAAPNHNSVLKSQGTEEKPLQCQHCAKCFSSKLELVTHQITHVRKPYSCSECGRSFFSHSGLVTHQKTHTDQRLFQCPLCGKSFISNAHLLLHQEIHAESSSIVCSENKTQERPDVSRVQREDTAGNYISCPECGECFYSSEHFLQHQKSHFRSNPFICPDCGKGFIRKSGLSKHQRVVHQGDVSYSCFGCGKGFSCKSELVRHITVHTGEKPFSCSECGKCFSFKSALVRHQRIHNGDRPHCCSECGKAFSCNSDLVRHQATHQKNIICVKV